MRLLVSVAIALGMWACGGNAAPAADAGADASHDGGVCYEGDAEPACAACASAIYLVANDGTQRCCCQ